LGLFWWIVRARISYYVWKKTSFSGLYLLSVFILCDLPMRSNWQRLWFFTKHSKGSSLVQSLLPLLTIGYSKRQRRKDFQLPTLTYNENKLISPGHGHHAMVVDNSLHKTTLAPARQICSDERKFIEGQCDFSVCRKVDGCEKAWH
jgi:hypothetical protein